MFVDGIKNIPVAVNCVGETKAVWGHDIIRGPTSKPTNGTCEADIWGDWSIWYVALCPFLPRCSDDVCWTKQGGKTFEGTVFHSICPTEVDISKFVVNVLD